MRGCGAYDEGPVAMLLAPRPRSTAADLLRLAALWLAAIVLAQGLAAAQALGLGSLHRHRDVEAARVHLHAMAERHHHDAADASVLPEATGDAAIDGAAFALTAALALMAVGSAQRRSADPRRHVWRAATPWAWRTTVPAGLRKPPRLG
jgi:hypothetical protein